jgi:phage tail sheath gpL-like
VLRSLKTAVTSKYARTKLAADGTRFAPGSAIVTPSMIRAELIAQYRQLEFDGLVQGSDLPSSAGLIVQQNAAATRTGSTCSTRRR